jgi:hypothetical protein
MPDCGNPPRRAAAGMVVSIEPPVFFAEQRIGATPSTMYW